MASPQKSYKYKSVVFGLRWKEAPNHGILLPLNIFIAHRTCAVCGTSVCTICGTSSCPTSTCLHMIHDLVSHFDLWGISTSGIISATLSQAKSYFKACLIPPKIQLQHSIIVNLIWSRNNLNLNSRLLSMK